MSEAAIIPVEALTACCRPDCPDYAVVKFSELTEETLALIQAGAKAHYHFWEPADGQMRGSLG